MKKIEISELGFNPWERIGKGWFLLTSGDMDSYNTMTASWGFAGVMWRKNVFNAVVRPTRYTYEFMEKNDIFTASFLGDEHRAAMSFCGSHSGRDCDKAKETGLTPISVDGSVAFGEAELILVCRKIYAQDMDISLLAEDIKPINGTDPMHKQYIGEILAAYVKE